MLTYYIDNVEVSKDIYYQKLNTNFYDETIVKAEKERKFYLFSNKIKKVETQRKQRELLMRQGFDVWEKAVLRGREVDDPVVMNWYEKLKKLEDSAFENIPERIVYYLGGKK